MEILIALFYLVCIFGIFRWQEKHVRKRFGDYVADDAVTRIGMVLVSAMVVLSSVKALSMISGYAVSVL